MKCEKYSDWISLYIDGELKDKERVAFEDHISSCASCQEEINVIQEIIKNIKDLEAMELPKQFHQELMEKIQLEDKIQGQETDDYEIIKIPRNNKKWYSNWKLVSAMAATFIFSMIIFDPLKINFSKESLPESANIMLKSYDMAESAPEVTTDKFTPEVAMDIPKDASLEAKIQGRAFSLEEPLVETWILETSRYEEYKDAISQISKDMGLEVAVIEDLVLRGASNRQLTMELTLQYDDKKEFKTRIMELDEDIDIPFKEDIQMQNDGGNTSITILVIIVNERK